MAKRIDVLDIFRQSFRTLLNYPSLIGLFVLPAIVPLILFLFVLPVTYNYYLLTYNPLFLVLYFAILLVGVWVALIGVGGQLIALEKIRQKKKFDFWKVLTNGFNRSGRLFVAYILEEIFLTLGFLLFIIPGIYLSVKLALMIPACALGKKGLGIKRSWVTTKGNFWKILIFVIIWVSAFLLVGYIPFLSLAIILLLPVYITSLGLIYLKLKK